MKKKLLLTLFSCFLLLSVGLMTACNGGDTPADTTAEDTPAPTDAPTEEPTHAVTDPAEESSEAPTEAPTDEDTETPTEEPTAEPETDDGIPLNELTIGGVNIRDYTLVVQDGGADCVRDSADELIEYIEKATGGFRIPEEASDREIVVGITDRDTDKVTAARGEIKYDGYALLMDGNRLYITGSCDRGTMYGVYCFLEDYIGVRFLAKDTTVIIDQDEVAIPADVHTIHNPYFEMRDTYWYDMRYDQPTANHAKDNSFYDSSTPVSDIGGGIGYAGRFVHTINLLQDLPYQGNVQPCLTDENIYQLVLSNVRKWLDANPEATIISVSQNDSDPGKLGCQCANCKAIDDAEGTPMGSLLTFINRIANDIKDDYPGVYVDTLAYRYTRKAPKTIKPADNVIIRLCSIECCFIHPLSDDTCERNREFRKDIEEWSAICDNLYVWDYTYNNASYFTFYANFDVLWDNVQFFKEHNVTGMFLEGQQLSVSGEFAELRSYLLAKLLWDPDMTEEEYYACMDEFLQYYYGAGWEKIKEYMTRMTAFSMKHAGHIGIFDSPETMYPAMDEETDKRDKNFQFSRDMLALWQEAYELAETEQQKAHVEKSSVQAYYLCHLRGATADRKVYLKTVYELCEKYGIEYYKVVVPMPDPSKADDLNSLK